MNVPRVNLLTLTKTQADRVRSAMKDLDAAQAMVNGLLAMVQPDRATGFDQSTMTFYTEPQLANDATEDVQ